MRAFGYRFNCLIAAVALACACLSSAQAAAVPQSTLKLARKMISTVNATPTYTLVTSDRVRVNDKLRKRETIAVKQQQKPNCIYAHWIGDLHKGQEALYCHGRYDNKVKAHKGGFLGFITLSLKPTGDMAMKGERHPINKLNLYHIAQQTDTDLKAAQNGKDITFTKPVQKTVKGQPSSCFTVIHPDKGHRNTICVSQALHVPTSLTVKNDQGDTLGEYTFSKINLDAGLTAKDFDVNNKNYHF